MGATVLHIAGVVVAEFKERNGLISAMITGEKRLVKPPVDLPRASEADTDAV